MSHDGENGRANDASDPHDASLCRRRMLLAGTALVATGLAGGSGVAQAPAQPPAPVAGGAKPNILIIFGDDIGITNISAYSNGLMGYETPNIDQRLQSPGPR